MAVGNRRHVQDDILIHRHGLIIQMPMGEIAAGLGERAEIRKRLHGGDAREFLAEVVGVAAAVVRGMQQPVNVVEQVFLAQALPLAFRRIGELEMQEARVGDGVTAGVDFRVGCWGPIQQFRTWREGGKPDVKVVMSRIVILGDTLWNMADGSYTKPFLAPSRKADSECSDSGDCFHFSG